MSQNELPSVTLSRFSLKAEYRINSSPERIWKALTEEQRAWWGAPYLCCDDTRDIVLDLRAGGSLIEHGADGTQVIFGTVSGFTPNQYLEFDGSCGMRWPSFGNWSYMLEPDGEGTLLKVRHDSLGIFDAETLENYGKGWSDLMDTRLRAWVEKGEKLGLGHEPEWARRTAASGQGG